MAVEQPVKKYRKSGLEHFLKFVRDLPAPSPRAIDARLHELGYRGQHAARRAAALAAYRHVRRIKRIYLDGAKREELLPKQNLLLVGPTGSGKTHLVELLFQHILRLPTVIVDITSYSETGYVGQDPSTVLTRLLHAADDNPLLASVGIVCLDELDKIASGHNNAVFAGAGTTKDVTGLGVQRELLKMLEATEVVVPLELAHASYSDHVVLSTADVAFIGAGAFSGFHEIARRRAAEGDIGFGRTTGRAHAAEGVAVGLRPDDVEHVGSFQSYGFLPELVARFSRVVPFQPLDAPTLREILHDGVLPRLRREFEDEGFSLAVDDEVIERIVSECLRKEIGARGLTSILTRRLEAVAFEHFGEHPGATVRLRVEGDDIAIALCEERAPS